MQIIGRTLGFLDPPLSGQVTVALVHDAASKAEAEALAARMDSGVAAGSVTLVPRLVPADQVGSAGTPVLLVVGEPSPALVAAAGKGAVVVSTQPGCADTGACTISVQSEPKVEITLSRAAAEAAGVKVGAAFRMMIKER